MKLNKAIFTEGLRRSFLSPICRLLGHKIPVSSHSGIKRFHCSRCEADIYVVGPVDDWAYTAGAMFPPHDSAADGDEGQI